MQSRLAALSGLRWIELIVQHRDGQLQRLTSSISWLIRRRDQVGNVASESLGERLHGIERKISIALLDRVDIAGCHARAISKLFSTEPCLFTNCSYVRSDLSLQVRGPLLCL